MTLAHFIYIPGVLLFGIVVGYILGGRAAQMAKVEADGKVQRRTAREVARRARDRATAEANRGAASDANRGAASEASRGAASDADQRATEERADK